MITDLQHFWVRSIDRQILVTVKSVTVSLKRRFTFVAKRRIMTPVQIVIVFIKFERGFSDFRGSSFVWLLVLLVKLVLPTVQKPYNYMLTRRA